ncbi:plasmid replication/partition related protein [Lysobacter sp. CA196]|uniref:plasmid replication/partition related protein n=1 Tax=Lysobacter sp. CA196 TaxID=3455606 RepID=UPI003F8D4C28
MDILVNQELKAYIDPLTEEEHEALERSILAEGCRDALVLWGDVLVDGHNRYGICRKHGLPFQTVQNPRFQSIDDVYLWMIDQHLGRRSVSDFQRGVLALRKREILAERAAAGAPATAAADTGNDDAPWDTSAAEPGADTPQPAAAAAAKPAPGARKQRGEIAREARLSTAQVGLIETIHKQAAPEVVAAVKSGTLSLNAAAAVATLPEDEQRAAALAGKGELKEAAKRVRESRRKPREPREGDEGETSALDAALADQILALRQQVAELTAENEALREELALLQAAAA